MVLPEMTISKPERSSSKISAGILAYCERADGLEVLLVHPGGPYWRNKDAGAWSIPKGEINVEEDHTHVSNKPLSLDERFNGEAQRLRKEAQGTPPGVEREQLIRRTMQAEVAAHIKNGRFRGFTTTQIS
jgi:hypothetical protein